MAEEGKVSTTDTAEAVGAESTETKEETLDTAFEEGKGSGEEVIASEKTTTPEDDWGKHGLSQFSGKSTEDIAKAIQWQNQQYGKQANELGDLRKSREEYEALKQQITGQQVEKPSSEVKMDDYELAAFANAFNESPYAAIDKFIVPKLTESLTEKIFEKVEERFGKVLDDKSKGLADNQEFAVFKKEHPDYTKYTEVMRQLMTEEYLGDGTAYEETYKLAVLAQDESSLFNVTCGLMRKGVSFEEAREYATLKQGASANADTKTQQVKDEVGKAAAGLKRSTTGQANSEPEIKDMDDAFAPD